MRRRVRQIADAFAEHNLLSYAAAIAFQSLIALVPLTLLALGLLGATGDKRVWRKDLAPSVEHRVTEPVFHGIDYTVGRVLDHGTGGLITLAAVLSVWYLMAAMRAVIEALNTIHDVDDDRTWLVRLATAVGLGLATGACLFVSALLVIGLGPAGWPCAIVLLSVAVTLVLRFAPAQRPETRWATIGSGLIVVSWLVASALFGLWIQYVADFRSPVGALTTLLVLTSYLFVSAIVFLAGAQLDELLRKKT